MVATLQFQIFVGDVAEIFTGVESLMSLHGLLPRPAEDVPQSEMPFQAQGTNL
jgi:hypothetical protein